MYFDRRISETLLRELEAGAFSWLPEVCRESERLDLQLRGYPHKTGSWVTAYVGTTKVLDVHERDGRFWVQAGTSAQKWSGVPLPWPDLKRPQPLKALESHQDGIRSHTVRAAANVPEKWAGHEGRLQTLLARQAFPGLVVIDREAVIGFSSLEEKRTMRGLLVERFAAAIDLMRVRWSESEARKSWEEADVLALDTDGSLLVIEVKQGSDKRLGWAPAQAAYCAELFRQADQNGVALADNLEAMLAQRERLELVPATRPSVMTPLKVLPVVAVGTPLLDQERFGQAREMAQTLASDRHVGSGQIAIWTIDPDTPLLNVLT